ncbi:hypothetical protein EVA_19311 [gut metagenome]|uniref:Uncharacterized protein n=1 Tax=gut metagenome TaxID=749906 RepID=J9FSQ6_9ZZZZ
MDGPVLPRRELRRAQARPLLQVRRPARHLEPARRLLQPHLVRHGLQQPARLVHLRDAQQHDARVPRPRAQVQGRVHGHPLVHQAGAAALRERRQADARLHLQRDDLQLLRQPRHP